MKNLFFFIPFLLLSSNLFGMKININTANYGILKLEVEGGNTILEVKQKISDQIDIPINRQILTFNNDVLEDSKTISDYNIQKESTLDLKDSTLGIAESSSKSFSLKLYPNPAQNSIQVEGFKVASNYIIYDVSGKKIMYGRVANKEEIDISNLQKSSYVIKLENGEMKKFIKK